MSWPPMGLPQLFKHHNYFGAGIGSRSCIGYDVPFWGGDHVVTYPKGMYVKTCGVVSELAYQYYGTCT